MDSSSAFFATHLDFWQKLYQHIFPIFDGRERLKILWNKFLEHVPELNFATNNGYG